MLRAIKAFYYGTVINCVVMAFVLVAALRIAEVFMPWHLSEHRDRVVDTLFLLGCNQRRCCRMATCWSSPNKRAAMYCRSFARMVRQSGQQALKMPTPPQAALRDRD